MRTGKDAKKKLSLASLTVLSVLFVGASSDSMRRLLDLGDDRTHSRQKIGEGSTGLISSVDVRIAGIGNTAGEIPIVSLSAHTLPTDAMLFEDSLSVFVGSDVGG